jgi:hypothetical protein
MNTLVKRTLLLTLLALTILSISACGLVNVEVEPSPAGENGEKATEPSPTEEILPSESTPEEKKDQGPSAVVAWYGHVVGLPEGAEFDDFLLLHPEGVGAIGLRGADADVDAQIEALRDKEKPNNKAHFWGTLTCGVQDYNGCQIVVDRIRPDGPGPMFDPDPIEAWEGFMTSRPGGPGSGGDDYFTLTGDFNVQLGIWSEDQAIASQLEALRDTGKVFRVWGKVIAGIPDWSGTQIQVDRIEELEGVFAPTPEASAESAPDDGMNLYVNDRYNYQFRYPDAATVIEDGPVGFPSDELPQGMSADDYLAQLEKQYGKELCVRVEYALGYLYISAPPNQGARYVPCGRTGVGVGEMVEKVDSVDLGGEIVQAKGFEITGTSDMLDQHNETLYIQLPGGIVIEYGARPADATYEDYLVKGKPMLLQILASFKTLP